MHRWTTELRALAPEIQTSFTELRRWDLLAMRQWMDRSGVSRLLHEAASAPRDQLIGPGCLGPGCLGPAKTIEGHKGRLCAALVSLGRSGRAPKDVFDWILGQTFLWMEREVRAKAGPGLDRGIRTQLHRRDLQADPLAVRATASATIASAIDGAGQFDGSRPLLPWLLGIARNLTREAARTESPENALPRAPVDPDQIGRGVDLDLDQRDEREWMAASAFGSGKVASAGFTPGAAPPWAAAVLAHVLGDSPKSALELAEDLNIALPRLYKRATEVRARLRYVVESTLREQR